MPLAAAFLILLTPAGPHVVCARAGGGMCCGAAVIMPYPLDGITP